MLACPTATIHQWLANIILNSDIVNMIVNRYFVSFMCPKCFLLLPFHLIVHTFCNVLCWEGFVFRPSIMKLAFHLPHQIPLTSVTMLHMSRHDMSSEATRVVSSWHVIWYVRHVVECRSDMLRRRTCWKCPEETTCRDITCLYCSTLVQLITPHTKHYHLTPW